MKGPRSWRYILAGELALLLLLATVRVALHLFTNGQYGFHRDELDTLDNARYLDWGYVAYPPLTPAIARLQLELFGPSLVGARFFPALSQGATMLLAGLMARELGGGRRAQVAASLAAAVAPISLSMGAILQYISFDYLWWVLIAYLVIRLLKSEDPRWWLGIGAALGLGMMTKYTMAFMAAGVAGGLLLTRQRRQLRSRWLWGGVSLSLLIFLPNLVWQLQHDFISLQFLSSIHERDVRIGRTAGFLVDQLYASANLITIPLWVAGLYFFIFSPAGRKYRMLGWMVAIPFVLLLVAQGRSYYIAPVYPMLLAAGVVRWEHWLSTLSSPGTRLGWGATWSGLAVGGIVFGALVLPIAPVNSSLWRLSSGVHDVFVEQIGWPELVEKVAGIYASLPAEERSQAAILAGNYGEAGAVNLYGPAYGLPRAISGINSYWQRGYGDPPPQTLIVLGFTRDLVDRIFESCELAGHVSNRFGVLNEETKEHPDIFLCRKPRQPWPELWKSFRWFG